MNRNSVAFIIIVWLLTLSSSLHAQQSNKNIVNAIQLGTLYNKNSFTLKQVESNLVALVFISPECPLSQNYMLTLNQLQQNFSGKLTVIGIFSGSDYKDAAYTDFKKKYKVDFELLKDEDKLLTHTLGATITPEVFLINASRQIVYSGAIDNWVVSLGKNRKAASEFYLQDAVVQLLAGQPAKPGKTKAIGCFINQD